MEENYDSGYSELLQAEELSLMFERDTRRYSRFISEEGEDAR